MFCFFYMGIRPMIKIATCECCGSELLVVGSEWELNYRFSQEEPILCDRCGDEDMVLIVDKELAGS